MKKQVTVTKENREFLEKAFKVSSVMIWKALTFESDTDLARRIRKLAVERGGIEMCFCPVLETMRDSDGYMRQYLPNGVMLEFNKNDGNGSVFFKGKEVRHYDRVMVSEIKFIQGWAMTLK
jgi:hypothetical protein